MTDLQRLLNNVPHSQWENELSKLSENDLTELYNEAWELVQECSMIAIAIRAEKEKR